MAERAGSCIHGIVEQISLLMKKLILILIWCIWGLCLVALVLSLTDIAPHHPLQNYRLAVGMGFIALTGFTRLFHHKLKT